MISLMFERLILSLAVLAVFTIAMLTGNLNGTVLGVLAAAVGQVIASWFGSHQQTVQIVKDQTQVNGSNSQHKGQGATGA